MRKALALSQAHALPVVRVHHMEAHAIVTWLPPAPAAAPAAAAAAAVAAGAAADGSPPFPFLTLLVSGRYRYILKLTYIFLTLLVSGVHNMLVLTREIIIIIL